MVGCVLTDRTSHGHPDSLNKLSSGDPNDSNPLPTVSFVIPVKNAVSTIDAAIESVLQQTYRYKELIVVDGMSTDGTLGKLKSYGPLISKLICEPDAGIYDAMNKGIASSTGAWLLFLGADDTLAHHDILSEIFDRKLVDIRNEFDLIYGGGYCNGAVLRNSFNWRILKGNSLNHQCVFYRRTLFTKYRYDTSYRIAGDYKLNIQLYIDGVKAARCHSVIGVFGNTGISHSYATAAAQENSRVRIEVLGAIMGRIMNGVRVLIDSAKLAQAVLRLR